MNDVCTRLLYITCQSIWGAILNTSIVDNDTDFFKGGAGSMDVVR